MCLVSRTAFCMAFEVFALISSCESKMNKEHTLLFWCQEASHCQAVVTLCATAARLNTKRADSLPTADQTTRQACKQTRLQHHGELKKILAQRGERRERSWYLLCSVQSFAKWLTIPGIWGVEHISCWDSSNILSGEFMHVSMQWGVRQTGVKGNVNTVDDALSLSHDTSKSKFPPLN